MTFKKIRKFLQAKGLVPSSCRERTPYYYSRNGSRCRERSPGHVVIVLDRILREQDPIYSQEPFGSLYPPASWCAGPRRGLGYYPRTKASLRLEAEGESNFWNLLAPLAQSMMDKEEEACL